MRKLLYFATIGMLAFSIGGCGGDGGTPPSPSPSPGAASPLQHRPPPALPVPHRARPPERRTFPRP
ncbi:MAG: hypothetical protein HC894_25645 [Microcoleus sp. SM1_3_4]|nr:hypothetical protein [Microcoleus sp. SM1_3_4]